MCVANAALVVEATRGAGLEPMSVRRRGRGVPCLLGRNAPGGAGGLVGMGRGDCLCAVGTGLVMIGHCRLGGGRVLQLPAHEELQLWFLEPGRARVALALLQQGGHLRVAVVIEAEELGRLVAGAALFGGGAGEEGVQEGAVAGEEGADFGEGDFAGFGRGWGHVGRGIGGGCVRLGWEMLMVRTGAWWV